MIKEDSELLKHFVAQIKDKKQMADAVGSESGCYFVGRYAVLKSKTPVKNPNKKFGLFSDFNTMENFNNSLIKLGFPTCKIFSYFFDNDSNYYELQERVYGRTLYRFNTENLVKELGLNIKSDADLTKLPKPIREKLAQEVFDYNTKTQTILATAPQQHFDSLLSGIVAINKIGIDQFDNNAENIRYSKQNGFRIIDPSLCDMYLDHMKNYKNKFHKVDDEVALCNMMDFFTDSVIFTCFDKDILSKEQVEKLQHGNLRIAKKIITAADNNNIDIKQDSRVMSELEGLVGEKNVQKYMDQLFFGYKFKESTPKR